MTRNPRIQEKTRATVCNRSEEHTSELQSRLHLVCRLLLEKKQPDTTAVNSEDAPILTPDRPARMPAGQHRPPPSQPHYGPSRRARAENSLLHPRLLRPSQP